MRGRLDRSLERRDSDERGEAYNLERAQAERKLREAPDFVRERNKDEIELERRQEEADKVWQECGGCRSDFAREFGKDSHQYLEERIRRQELARGREEGPGTFEIEKRMIDSKGREHRPDFWDHEAKAIDDIKPVHAGETVGELVERHHDQLSRYAEKAEETTGEKIREVGIRPYPGIEGRRDEDR